MFITGVNDTGDKLFSGVINTGENFIANVIDFQWSLVSLIPAISIIAGDNDTGDKFIADDKNKDVIEVGSCQREEKLAISGRWRRTRLPMASLEPPWKVASINTPHILVSWSEAPKSSKTK